MYKLLENVGKVAEKLKKCNFAGKKAENSSISVRKISFRRKKRRKQFENGSKNDRKYRKIVDKSKFDRKFEICRKMMEKRAESDRKVENVEFA